MKPVENSNDEKLETYYEIEGLSYTLYKNDSLVLYLTIC